MASQCQAVAVPAPVPCPALALSVLHPHVQEAGGGRLLPPLELVMEQQVQEPAVGRQQGEGHLQGQEVWQESGQVLGDP